MNKAGELVDVSLHCAPLLVDGARLGYVYTFRDIGERKRDRRQACSTTRCTTC